VTKSKWLFLLFVAALAGLFWFARGGDDRLELGSREPFAKGPYHAFAQPWGAQDSRLVRYWAPFADKIDVDAARFPNNTRFRFTWPFWRPSSSTAGVWGYSMLSFGNYDGGDGETKIPPRRVYELLDLSQRFAWSSSMALGDANLLTEFYLRSNPNNSDAKLIEIGWFLHAPAATAAFVRGAQQIGRFTDAGGKAWQVARDEKYVMLLPADGRDVRAGTIDMRAALQWLQEKGVIKGDEWFTGVAIGVEPLRGRGQVQIDRWAVTSR